MTITYLSDTLDWANPDYTEITKKRLIRLERIRSDSKVLAAHLKFYENNHINFIEDWMQTYDPRRKDWKYCPFILFPRQRQYLHWLEDLIQDREDGVVDKSRDMGVTWLCVAKALCMWLFQPGVKIGIGSRKENLVDRIGDPDSIFEKFRLILRNLPPEFLPRGFDLEKNSPHMKLVNPENGSVIAGEAGDNIGRGGRSSVYFKDEALVLCSQLLTPFGWSTIGQMKVGDEVYGADGTAQRITQIKDFDSRDIYEIKFRDGTFTKCSPYHLWTVDKIWGGKKRLTLNTKDLADNYKYSSPGGQTQYKYRIPTCDPVEFYTNSELPLDSYVVGALLGDGSVSQGSMEITSADKEIVDQVKKSIPEGCEVRFRRKYHYGINGLSKYVKKAGIYGCCSWEKFIPEKYKFTSIENRLALLQGLMDTDGSASGGNTTYHTTSEKLAGDVKFLVQSLGGTASLRVKPDHRGYRDVYVLHVRIPDQFCPFRLTRKKDLLYKKQAFSRTIVSVKKLDKKKPVRCLTVSNEDGLYLINDFIVTHNSAFYEHPERVEASLSQNSDVKIDVSTHSGPGTIFQQKCQSDAYRKFEFDWHDDPRKDQDWYDKQCELHDPVIIAREIDRNPDASIENICIPGHWVKASVALGKMMNWYRPDAEGKGGLDVGGGSAESVFVPRFGSRCYMPIAWKDPDSINIATKSKEIAVQNNIPLINYDSVGVGLGVTSAFRRLTGVKTQGINNGSSPSSLKWPDGKYSKDKFSNIKAEMWYLMRDAIRKAYLHYLYVTKHEKGVKQDLDEILLLPDDPKLITQLSQPRREQTESGKIYIEKKSSLLKRGIKSPDRADALALTYVRVSTFTITDIDT